MGNHNYPRQTERTLPKNVISYVAQKKYGTIKEAAKIVKADGSVIYEAEVKKGDLLFDQFFYQLNIRKPRRQARTRS